MEEEEVIILNLAPLAYKRYNNTSIPLGANSMEMTHHMSEPWHLQPR